MFVVVKARASWDDSKHSRNTVARDRELLISQVVYRRARLSTRCVAVNIFDVRLAGMTLLRERDDISVSF